MAAQAFIPMGSHSGRNPADPRRHFQLLASAWAMDAPARTRFVRTRRAGAANADREHAWTVLAQIDRAQTRTKRAMTLPPRSRFDFRPCGLPPSAVLGM